MSDPIIVKVPQTIYYDNKPDFLKLLKARKLKWSPKTPNVQVEGWFNATPDGVQKLPEEGYLKVFKIFGCPEIVKFLSSLSVVEPSPYPTTLPWKIGDFWKFQKKQLLDNWDSNFKVKWSEKC